MKIEDLKKVAVIGAGDMGHGIAQVALMGGYEVVLCDINKSCLDRGIERIHQSLEKFAAKGKVDAALPGLVKNERLTGCTAISEAVKDVDLVIEVAPEVPKIKHSVLKEIDENAPEHAVIFTNTSSMDITMLSEAVSRKDKLIGTHYFNPAVLMKLVEVIRGEHTSDETTQFACDYVKKVGKELILANKCTPGFIANRIGAPVDVYRGVLLDYDKIDVADADISMRNAGMKMGLYLLSDFCGLDVQCDGMRYYEKNLSPDYAPPQTTLGMIAENKLGKKSGTGFYEWPERGLPELDETHFTGTFDADIPYFIEANEACKLVEEGICTFEDCDRAMIYGYNTPGPIEYIQKFEPEYVAKKLQEIADKYDKKVFEPTETIKNGRYLR
ncbi:MAG: 3-hydroxybutyryl-CoA dehydrogenase [Christensenellaceae bacterium]|nr:3-hydroxybutyryl-CoA dehydrogenase [Christensenellaceae bacterium]